MVSSCGNYSLENVRNQVDKMSIVLTLCKIYDAVNLAKSQYYGHFIHLFGVEPLDDIEPEVTAREYVAKVAGGYRPKMPFYTPPAWKALIESCWHQDPNKRPLFQQIVESLISDSFSMDNPNDDVQTKKVMPEDERKYDY